MRDRITFGNSFPLSLTVRNSKGEAIDASQINGLSVGIFHVGSQEFMPVEYQIIGGIITTHVTKDVAKFLGVYRVIVSGEFEGEKINRNPIAFEIVRFVENESFGNSCLDIEVNPVLLDVNLIPFVAINISFADITGDPLDNESLKETLDKKVDEEIFDEFTQLAGYAFSGVRDDISEVDGRVDLANESIAVVSGRVDSVDAKLISANNRIDSAETKINESNKKINAANTRIDEANARIDKLDFDMFIPVEVRPETGIPNRIYLVKRDNPQENNIYDEWTWINGKWEYLGQIKIDLSGYATEEWADARFLNKNTGGKIAGPLEVEGDLSVNNRNILTEIDDILAQMNLAYGIEWDITAPSSACRRIGRPELHQILPIQSKMRKCLLKDDGSVNYYLHPDNSLLRENGLPANLDGSDGQVMVEIPEHYIRFESDGNLCRCWISEHLVPGFKSIQKCYCSAYEASLNRSNSKLSSVVNNTAEYRGGNNNAAWDGTYRSLLGMPATVINLNNFRTYARNRGAYGKSGAGWNCNVYDIYKAIFWLYSVEYANFNCQLPFNSELTANGYRQGGLGDGVTTLNSSLWNNFNSYYPFVPCGYTNRLGNKTGIVDFVMPEEYGVLTVKVPSYRGIENPFGHLWKWTDGVLVNIQSDADGGLSELYVSNNHADFSGSSYTNYQMRGLLPRKEGWVKKLIMGEFGENMPLEIGGSSSTFFADYFYTSIPASGVSLRGVLFGGTADYGAGAGFGCAYAGNAAAGTGTHVGSRLCFIPA